jgi:uracil-DNA glycosylase
MAKRRRESVAGLLPDRLSISTVRAAAKGCRACDLWKRGTQTVFGEGPKKAARHPFVGPAGKLLDRALAEAGIDRSTVYVTNVVKHFKWEPRGKRRIHKKPNAGEITACRPWLETEIALVKPRDGLSRRDGRPGAARQWIQGHGSSRRACQLAAGPAGHGHGASFVAAARPRR